MNNKLTEDDYEWLDRIGVTPYRMEIIKKNQEKAKKWDELYVFYKMWKKGGTDETFCDVFEEMNGGISALEELLEGKK